MMELFDLWSADPRAMEIREFSTMTRAIQRELADPTYFSQPDEVRPLRIVTIDKAGNISTASPEFAGARAPEWDDFVLGSVHDESDLDTILTRPRARKFRTAIDAGVRNCAATCTYFALCGGGSPSNKYFENRSLESTTTTSCILHKQTLAEVVIGKIEQATQRNAAASASIAPPKPGQSASHR